MPLDPVRVSSRRVFLSLALTIVVATSGAAAAEVVPLPPRVVATLERLKGRPLSFNTGAGRFHAWPSHFAFVCNEIERDDEGRVFVRRRTLVTGDSSSDYRPRAGLLVYTPGGLPAAWIGAGGALFASPDRPGKLVHHPDFRPGFQATVDQSDWAFSVGGADDGVEVRIDFGELIVGTIKRGAPATLEDEERVLAFRGRGESGMWFRLDFTDDPLQRFPIAWFRQWDHQRRGVDVTVVQHHRAPPIHDPNLRWLPGDVARVPGRPTESTVLPFLSAEALAKADRDPAFPAAVDALSRALDAPARWDRRRERWPTLRDEFARAAPERRREALTAIRRELEAETAVPRKDAFFIRVASGEGFRPPTEDERLGRPIVATLRYGSVWPAFVAELIALVDSPEADDAARDEALWIALTFGLGPLSPDPPAVVQSSTKQARMLRAAWRLRRGDERADDRAWFRELIDASDEPALRSAVVLDALGATDDLAGREEFVGSTLAKLTDERFAGVRETVLLAAAGSPSGRRCLLATRPATPAEELIGFLQPNIGRGDRERPEFVELVRAVALDESESRDARLLAAACALDTQDAEFRWRYVESALGSNDPVVLRSLAVYMGKGDRSENFRRLLPRLLPLMKSGESELSQSAAQVLRVAAPRRPTPDDEPLLDEFLEAAFAPDRGREFAGLWVLQDIHREKSADALVVRHLPRVLESLRRTDDLKRFAYTLHDLAGLCRTTLNDAPRSAIGFPIVDAETEDWWRENRARLTADAERFVRERVAR